MKSLNAPLILIGGGNMGRAIVQGAIRAGIIAPSKLVVLDPDTTKHPPFTALGSCCSTSADEAFLMLDDLESKSRPGIILLAVKPQMLDIVAEALERVGQTHPPTPARLLLSILAGIPTTRLDRTLRGRTIRLMPNTPAQIGKGITALCPGHNATAEDIEIARKIFQAVGKVIDLPEDLLDAFTAVAGSGPAYLFHLAEAMATGAEAVGFERQQALDIVRATIVGAAGLLDADPDTEPAQLRERVTSKGGTTAAAIRLLEDRAVLAATRDAIIAARDRGRELANQ